MNAIRRPAGFTLLEVVMALSLLAVMLAMLFAGLRSAARAWEAGSARGDRADQIALFATFVRRELSVAFPWRFKDAAAVRLAFDGDANGVRFVSMRPSDIGGGGLAFVALQYEPGSGTGGGRLVMRRAFADAAAADFKALDEAEPFPLIEGVESARISYFGSENDLESPTWRDAWQVPARLPTHVRLEVRLPSMALPDALVALRLGEEAGCVELGFQRACAPRR